MHLLALIGLAPVCFTLSATAANAPFVTEAEVLSHLGRNSPIVVELSEQLALARAEAETAGRLSNPSIDVLREDLEGPGRQTEWTLSWQLPDSARGLRIAAAHKSVDAAVSRNAYQLNELRANLRQDYANWAVASARRQLLVEEESRLSSLAKRERLRAEKGEVSGLAAHRLTLALTTLRNRLSLFSAVERQGRASVERWVPVLAPDAQPRLPELNQLPPIESAAKGANADLKEPPLLAALRAELEVAELSQRSSERYLASPELTLGWQRQTTLSETMGGPVFGLSWTLPLFDRKHAARATARVRRDAVRARGERMARELNTRRAAATDRYSEMLRAVARSEEVLATSTNMLAAAEASFRYGELELSDLLAIQRSVTESHLTWLELYAAALAAQRELELLTAPSPTKALDPVPRNTAPLDTALRNPVQSDKER